MLQLPLSARAGLVALFALLPCASPAPAMQATAAQPVEVEAKGEALLKRVAVIGASVSSGFRLGKDANNAPIDLARILEASLLAPHEKVLGASSAMTFLDPVRNTAEAVTNLQAYKPTVIVGLDYLFWFGYGTNWKGEDGRLAALEKGLAPLAEFKCPILLGDFPDMSSALQAKEPMLFPDAVPAPDVLAKLNARVMTWAKEHPNVIVVPMARLMDTLRNGQELHIGKNVWAKTAVPGLLQADGLHTTLEGTTGLWVLAAEQLFAARKDLPRTTVEPSVEAIVKKLDPNAVVAAKPDLVQAKAEKAGTGKKTH